jgi:fatty acid desaturase
MFTDKIRSDFQRMFSRSMIAVYVCAIVAFILFALADVHSVWLPLMILVVALGGYFFRDNTIAHETLTRIEREHCYYE